MSLVSFRHCCVTIRLLFLLVLFVVLGLVVVIVIVVVVVVYDGHLEFPLLPQLGTSCEEMDPLDDDVTRHVGHQTRDPLVWTANGNRVVVIVDNGTPAPRHHYPEPYRLVARQPTQPAVVP